MTVANAWVVEWHNHERRADKEAIITAVHQVIITEIASYSKPLPRAHEDTLREIIVMAYDWNVSIHCRGLTSFFRPFCPSLGSQYDPVSCELYYPEETSSPDANVAVVASIGLEMWLLEANKPLQLEVTGLFKAQVLM